MPRNNYVPRRTQELMHKYKTQLNLPWKVFGEVMKLNDRRRYRLVNDEIHLGPITYARLLLLNSFLEKKKVGLNPLDLPVMFQGKELKDALEKIKNDR